jgi:hypothetical protein
MFKVKIKRLFKLQPYDRLMKVDDVVEMTEKEVEAVKKQLDHSYIEIIEEIKADEIDFDDMNVPDLENWLKDNNVEFDPKAKKPQKVKLAQEKVKELEEQEENIEE